MAINLCRNCFTSSLLVVYLRILSVGIKFTVGLVFGSDAAYLFRLYFPCSCMATRQWSQNYFTLWYLPRAIVLVIVYFLLLLVLVYIAFSYLRHETSRRRSLCVSAHNWFGNVTKFIVVDIEYYDFLSVWSRSCFFSSIRVLCSGKRFYSRCFSRFSYGFHLIGERGQIHLTWDPGGFTMGMTSCTRNHRFTNCTYSLKGDFNQDLVKEWQPQRQMERKS